MSRSLGFLSTAAAAVLVTASLTTPASATDGMPSNMIFFTDQATCPAGSTRPAQANGRLMIAVTDTGEIGNTYGKPLADQEDRTHTHSATLNVSIPSHHISAASGGGNGQATKHGTYSVKLTTQPATSGLPFIQLLACQVQ